MFAETIGDEEVGRRRIDVPLMRARRRVLMIDNLSVVPFRNLVRDMVTESLRGLEGILEIDFAGGGRGDYTLTFVDTYSWTRRERRRCRYAPLRAGTTFHDEVRAEVYVEALRRINMCEDSYRCETCTSLFPSRQEMLGKAIGIVALHEIGHLFGLYTESSYTDADENGHTGDPANFMFAIPRHRDYKSIGEDDQRTTIYEVREGDNLSKISRRLCLRSWRVLYNFRGRDGQRNRDLLKSGDPHLIFPGEKIWIPNIRERIEFLRKIKLADKSFSEEQTSFMRRWIKEGRR